MIDEKVVKMAKICIFESFWGKNQIAVQNFLDKMCIYDTATFLYNNRTVRGVKFDLRPKNQKNVHF